MMRGGWRPGMEYPDPRSSSRTSWPSPPRACSLPDSRQRYKEELEKRAASRKQVFIDNFVAKLDQDLVLTSEQRDKLVGGACGQLEGLVGPVAPDAPESGQLLPQHPRPGGGAGSDRTRRKSGGGSPGTRRFSGGSASAAMVWTDPLDDPELAEARKEAQAKEKP